MTLPLHQICEKHLTVSGFDWNDAEDSQLIENLTNWFLTLQRTSQPILFSDWLAGQNAKGIHEK
ncbi:hypothetical protein [Thalassospira sp.]|uniref:hypothetical protein n=1 Tax=Thalassospira sp. TaxID=1912094 RepID=UPI0027353B65|nr:hypothetical protein [Thalassospira sp.]MDP2699155.1 hypothetical protein [Thalassospira sp.]